MSDDRARRVARRAAYLLEFEIALADIVAGRNLDVLAGGMWAAAHDAYEAGLEAREGALRYYQDAESRLLRHLAGEEPGEPVRSRAEEEALAEKRVEAYIGDAVEIPVDLTPVIRLGLEYSDEFRIHERYVAAATEVAARGECRVETRADGVYVMRAKGGVR